MISARKAKHLDVTTMFTYSHANTPLGQSERAYYLSYFIISQVTPKPLYENEHATAFWDVPLFADATQVKGKRIDATVIDKTS